MVSDLSLPALNQGQLHPEGALIQPAAMLLSRDWSLSCHSRLPRVLLAFVLGSAGACKPCGV